jgi:hypothetical protein
MRRFGIAQVQLDHSAIPHFAVERNFKQFARCLLDAA